MKLCEVMWCDSSVAQLSSALAHMNVGAARKFYIISEMNCKVLDINGANPVSGTKAIMWPRKPGPPASNQLWYFDSQGVIRSALNDFIMEAPGQGSPPFKILSLFLLSSEELPNFCLNFCVTFFAQCKLGNCCHKTV